MQGFSVVAAIVARFALMAPWSPQYSTEHQKTRARTRKVVLAGGARCARCGGLIQPGEPWDLGHVDGDPSRYAGPEHRRCNRATSGRALVLVDEVEPERDGLAADDPVWQVPWLDELRRVPKDATWPRLMTVPHPRAVASIGPEFIAWAEARSGPLRWWQRLVATRLLEVDEDDQLVWEVMLLSLARQLGKSWLLRELCLWRMHQGGRFGEEQTVLHTGKDVAICKDVQRPARRWAKEECRSGLYKVREVNGQEQIEYLPDGSRWMLLARDAVYGYSASCAAVDEAWKVKKEAIDDGLLPTMVERAQSQLWLISTAHREATPLMVLRRAAALDQLETADGDLLIEWSTPRSMLLDDVDGWRLASPHWTERRRRLIARQIDGLRSGTITDAEEANPEESLTAQWLNRWPRVPLELRGVTELIPPGLWANLAEEGVGGDGGLFVALEDNFGFGAAIAAALILADGRIEVDGWHCASWDAAIVDAKTLQLLRPVRQLMVGANLLDRVPPGMNAQPVGTTETREGLPLLRDLAAIGLLVHDVSTVELDAAVQASLVKETASGLTQVNKDARQRTLVKALAWAVHAAHHPEPMPSIY